MPEQDLKLICQSIPVSDTGTVSTQAHNILKGLTGDEVEFDIQTGGNLPTLFPPVITDGFNKATWTKGNNGGFSTNTTYKVYVNDVEVQVQTAQYNYQQSDNGKVLKVVLSNEDFNDAQATISIVYHDMSGADVKVNVVIPATAAYNTCFYLDPYGYNTYNKFGLEGRTVSSNNDILIWAYDVANQTLYVADHFIFNFVPGSRYGEYNGYELLGKYDGPTSGLWYRAGFRRNVTLDSTWLNNFQTAVRNYSVGYNAVPNSSSVPSGTPDYVFTFTGDLQLKQNGNICSQVIGLNKSFSITGTNQSMTASSMLYKGPSSDGWTGTANVRDHTTSLTGTITFTLTVSE